jgi:hypothetical protein
MLSCDVAKIGASLRRKEAQHTLPIIWNEGIEENQAAYLTGRRLCHAAYNHARVAMTYKDHLLRQRRERQRNIGDVLG